MVNQQSTSIEMEDVGPWKITPREKDGKRRGRKAFNLGMPDDRNIPPGAKKPLNFWMMMLGLGALSLSGLK